MSKLIVSFLMLFLTISSCFAKARVVTIPTADIKKSKDHPLLKRYAGSYIVAHQYKSYDEFTFPLSKLEAGKFNSVGFTLNLPKEKKTVEGPYTRLVYLLPADRSSLEVIRNYQDEISAQGGKVLYQCKREECGGSKKRGIHDSGSGATSLAMFLKPYSRLGMKDYSPGYCATTPFIMDQRYLVAELPDVGAHISVHTYIFKDGGYYNNCDAYKGRGIVVVDIVEGKSREKKMVTIQAKDMAKKISASGSVALYGIYFDSNKAKVKSESSEALEQIAKLMKDSKSLKLLVVGHTDNVGKFSSNLDLSQRRASAVVKELVTKYKISKKRLMPAGVSFAAPIASNSTDEGKAKNRRVVLVENK
jgi:outer membrane protein OmpA-like peptidoglycan-associated protein